MSLGGIISGLMLGGFFLTLCAMAWASLKSGESDWKDWK